MVAALAPRILLDSDWVIKRGRLSSLGRRRVPGHGRRLRHVVAAAFYPRIQHRCSTSVSGAPIAASRQAELGDYVSTTLSQLPRSNKPQRRCARMYCALPLFGTDARTLSRGLRVRRATQAEPYNTPMTDRARPVQFQAGGVAPLRAWRGQFRQGGHGRRSMSPTPYMVYNFTF